MIKKMSSQELLSHARKLATDERKATVALVESLAEIDRRKLYLENGYGSLWEFATQYLKLSEGSAQRRIQAARLLIDVPEVKASLELGSLSLSNAAKVQGFRQKEKKQGRTPDAPELVRAVESLSQTECEAKLFELSPSKSKPRREGKRVVSSQAERELRFVVSSETFDKLERIKGLIAHARPHATLAELIGYLADEQLALLEKKLGIVENSDDGSQYTQGSRCTQQPEYSKQPECPKQPKGAKKFVRTQKPKPATPPLHAETTHEGQTVNAAAAVVKPLPGSAGIPPSRAAQGDLGEEWRSVRVYP